MKRTLLLFLILTFGFITIYDFINPMVVDARIPLGNQSRNFIIAWDRITGQKIMDFRYMPEMKRQSANTISRVQRNFFEENSSIQSVEKFTRKYKRDHTSSEMGGRFMKYTIAGTAALYLLEEMTSNIRHYFDSAGRQDQIVNIPNQVERINQIPPQYVPVNQNTQFAQLVDIKRLYRKSPPYRDGIFGQGLEITYYQDSLNGYRSVEVWGKEEDIIRVLGHQEYGSIEGDWEVRELNNIRFTYEIRGENNVFLKILFDAKYYNAENLMTVTTINNERDIDQYFDMKYISLIPSEFPVEESKTEYDHFGIGVDLPTHIETYDDVDHGFLTEKDYIDIFIPTTNAGVDYIIKYPDEVLNPNEERIKDMVPLPSESEVPKEDIIGDEVIEGEPEEEYEEKDDKDLAPIPGTGTGTNPGEEEEELPPSPPGSGFPIEGELDTCTSYEFDHEKFTDLIDSFSNSFPFSIPWDVGRAIESFFGDMVTDEFPEIKIPLNDHEINIVLPPLFDSFFTFFRTAFLYIFDIGLIYALRKWLGGAS